MPNRIIKDSLWTSKKLARCNQKAQLHYPRIYLRVDDWSCCEIDIEDIIQTCYKKWHPKPRSKAIIAILKEFETNGLLFTWEDRGNAYGYFTGEEEGRLPSPTRKHKRHTPEPPQEELASYLQNYNCLRSDYKALQSDYLSPSPSPSLKHSPSLKKNLAEFVSLSKQEHQKLVDTYGKQQTQTLITTLDNYKGSSGKKYKSDYRAILSWVVEKVGAKEIAPTPEPVLVPELTPEEKERAEVARKKAMAEMKELAEAKRMP